MFNYARSMVVIIFIIVNNFIIGNKHFSLKPIKTFQASN